MTDKYLERALQAQADQFAYAVRDMVLNSSRWLEDSNTPRIAAAAVIARLVAEAEEFEESSISVLRLRRLRDRLASGGVTS